MKSSKSNTLTIIGAGVLGQHIAHYALQTNTFTSISFIDDTCPPNTLTEYGRVIGSIEQISQLIDLGAIKNLAIGIGYKHFELRTTIFEKYIKKNSFPKHNTCYSLYRQNSFHRKWQRNSSGLHNRQKH